MCWTWCDAWRFVSSVNVGPILDCAAIVVEEFNSRQAVPLVKGVEQLNCEALRGSKC